MLFFFRQFFLIIATGFFCLSGSGAQCPSLEVTAINRLAGFSFQRKIKLLRQLNAELLSISGDSKKCEYRTFTRCRSYISDTQWHWAEIITVNSCDQILSYSTSDQDHFEQLKQKLIERYRPIGISTYNNLEFQVYRNKKGQTIEFNEHPNQQGKMFYLLNINKDIPKKEGRKTSP